MFQKQANEEIQYFPIPRLHCSTFLFTNKTPTIHPTNSKCLTQEPYPSELPSTSSPSRSGGGSSILRVTGGRRDARSFARERQMPSTTP
ncbi:hypothetical protein Trydic_g9260 [Trypoxylus dichotomus]